MFRFFARFPVLAAAAVVAGQAASPLDNPIATVASSGEVSVGAAALKATGVRSWPVLAGDQISTDDEGSALVSSAAMGLVEVRKNSKVTVAEDHVSLQKGAVGSEGLPVRLRGYTVSAKDHGARNWFVVADQEGQSPRRRSSRRCVYQPCRSRSAPCPSRVLCHARTSSKENG